MYALSPRALFLILVFSLCNLGFGIDALPLQPPEASIAGSALASATAPLARGMIPPEGISILFWIDRLSAEAFGAFPYAVRLPGVLFSLCATVITARGAAHFFGERAGMWAGVMMAASLFLGVFGKSATDGPLWMLLSAVALIAFARQRYRLAYACVALCGVAFGLWGMAFPVLAMLIALIFTGDVARLFHIRLGQGAIIIVLLLLPWFAAMHHLLGNNFLPAIMSRIIAEGTNSFPYQTEWYFVFIAFLALVFPWTGALLQAIYEGTHEEGDRGHELMFFVAWLLAAGIFLLLSPSHPIPHILLAAPPAFILIGAYVANREENYADRFGSWSLGNGYFFLLAGLGFSVGTLGIASVADVGFAVGVALLILGILISITLYVWHRLIAAMWLTVASGLFITFMLFTMILPQVASK